MTFLFMCEPCREACGIAADRTHLNRIRRQAQKPLPQVEMRDSDGKPFLIGHQEGEVHVRTSAGCNCDCSRAGHDPQQCNGLDQFRIGGRPGSGFVDELAKNLGAEPIPEQVVSLHGDCEVLVNSVLAWWIAAPEDDVIELERQLENMGYEKRLDWLHDLLKDERPDLLAEEPYASLRSRLRRLAKFRNQIAHSRPIGGDYFKRVKREKGVDTIIHLNAEELAKQLDGAMALISQVHHLPQYLDPEERARQAALWDTFQAHRAARSQSA